VLDRRRTEEAGVPLFKRDKPDEKPPDEEPIDMESRSPETGLKYKDIALLGQMLKQGANLKEPRHAVYYLYFGSQEQAVEAAAGVARADTPAKFVTRCRATRASGRSSASDPTRCSTWPVFCVPTTCSRGSPIA